MGYKQFLAFPVIFSFAIQRVVLDLVDSWPTSVQPAEGNITSTER